MDNTCHLIKEKTTRTLAPVPGKRIKFVLHFLGVLSQGLTDTVLATRWRSLVTVSPFLETPDNFPVPESIFSSPGYSSANGNYWNKLSGMRHEIIKIKI